MDKENLTKIKPLSVMKIAVIDKENLTSDLHRQKLNCNNTKMSITKRNKKNIDLGNRILLKKTTASYTINNINSTTKDQSTQTETITGSHLTNDNTNETYWSNLTESHKKALTVALRENRDLHNKSNELEYEISCLKNMLKEVKSLAEILNEMTEEKSEKQKESAKCDKEAQTNK